MPERTTILVTGATDGLGLCLARRLVERGHRVLLHGRDQLKLDRTLAELAGQSRPDLAPTAVRAELSDPAEVRRMAEHIGERFGRLDVLVNNAGIAYLDNRREISATGQELRIAVNFLAPFDLTLRLLPLLRAAGAARVVNVASAAQEPLDLDDIMFERGYTGPSAYARSKFAMVAAGFALARRLDPDVVTVNSLHPGSMMPTKMVAAHFGPTHSGDTLDSGVDAVDRLASDPALAGVTGRYFARMTEGTPHPRAHDHQIQERLWELLLTLTGAPDPATEISAKRRSWT